jgi:aryl-alcohol dehydrogenase-like predicted oxidoreductase
MLGRTGIRVSPLCIGTGTNGWGGKSVQTGMGHEALVELLEFCAHRGVTFWDSADQYGSHAHVRDALRRVGREKIVFTTKTCARTAEGARADIERYRRELDVEQIDLLLLHCLLDPEWPTPYAPVMRELTRARDCGWVRALGVSCHNFGAFQRAATEDWVEVVLARLNYANENMDATWQEVVEVLHTMKAAGKGIYGMKVMGAGKLGADPARAIDFVFEQRCVDAVTIGMRSRREVEQNLALVVAAQQRHAGERVRIAARR